MLHGRTAGCSTAAPRPNAATGAGAAAPSWSDQLCAYIEYLDRRAAPGDGDPI